MMHVCKAVLLDMSDCVPLHVTVQCSRSESLRFLTGGDIDSVCWRVKWAQVEHTEQPDQIEGSSTFSPPACFPADKLHIWLGSMEQARYVSFMSREVLCVCECVCVWGGDANSGGVVWVTVWNPLIRLQLGWPWMAEKLSIKLHLYPELNTLTPLIQGSVGEPTINCLCSRPTYWTVHCGCQPDVIINMHPHMEGILHSTTMLVFKN